ncbi:MAG: IS110 family transposase [Bdellovibrionales bacterium]
MKEYYIGMDAHSKTCTFVAIDARGKEIRSQRVQTTETEILRFVESFKGRINLTFEECQLSRWLHVVLKEKVEKLLVCNPCFIAKRAGPKNDYLDALHLAQQLRGDFLTPVFHEDSFLSDLRKIVKSYENLVHDLIRTKNRYKALYTSRGILLESKTIYRNEKLIDQLDKTSQFVARKLFDQVQNLVKLKAEYQSHFEEIAKSNHQIGVLTSIPGISAVRANIIAAAVVDPKRFATKNKFWSYCMLVKHDQQSDGKSYGKVTIFGKTNLKTVFMGTALSIFCMDCELNRYYQQQLAKGLGFRAARKNLARKVAAISLAVMKTGKPYCEREIKTVVSNLN